VLRSAQNCGHWPVENRSVHCAAAFYKQGVKICTDQIWISCTIWDWELIWYSHGKIEFMSMARAVRTVAVLSCGSSEHAERLASNADTTIWQVCFKCTLTFISSFTKTKNLTFLQFTRIKIFWWCSSSPARNRFKNRFEICFHPGGFLKRCMLVSSMKKSNTLLLQWF